MPNAKLTNPDLLENPIELPPSMVYKTNKEQVVPFVGDAVASFGIDATTNKKLCPSAGDAIQLSPPWLTQTMNLSTISDVLTKKKSDKDASAVAKEML